jgi:site-specific recombinase XerD
VRSQLEVQRVYALRQNHVTERKSLFVFDFDGLRHTFASWYMMNGGDLYELAKILGHSNIKMTERYAKLGREHITKTGTTAKVIWSLMKKKPEQEEGDQQDVA